MSKVIYVTGSEPQKPTQIMHAVASWAKNNSYQKFQKKLFKYGCKCFRYNFWGLIHDYITFKGNVFHIGWVKLLM